MENIQKPKIRHKYNAKITLKDDIKFDSKAEARYYEHLKLRKKAGEVIMFLRQVPFHLPGGVKYVVDFVEFLSNGTVDFVDVKGLETASFISKKKIVEALFPVNIKIVL